MAKRAAKQKSGITSFEEVDEMTLEIGRLDLQIERLQNELDSKKRDLDAKFAPPIWQMRATREELAADVLAFAELHKKEVTGKTWKGSFASISWPKASSVVRFLVSVEQLIKNLKKAKLTDYVHASETVNKNELKAIDEKRREKLGFVVEDGKEKPPELEIDRRAIELQITKKRR